MMKQFWPKNVSKKTKIVIFLTNDEEKSQFSLHSSAHSCDVITENIIANFSSDFLFDQFDQLEIISKVEVIIVILINSDFALSIFRLGLLLA
jgi:hypothetical protein